VMTSQVVDSVRADIDNLRPLLEAIAEELDPKLTVEIHRVSTTQTTVPTWQPGPERQGERSWGRGKWLTIPASGTTRSGRRRGGVIRAWGTAPSQTPASPSDRRGGPDTPRLSTSGHLGD